MFAQPRAYADGMFTQGGAPLYPYGAQVRSYGDGSLGCGPCGSFGDDAVPVTVDATSAAAALPAVPVTAAVGPNKLVIVGGIVIAAGVLYLIMRKKK